MIPLVSALLPAIVLIAFIYIKDKQNPEPTWQLVKGVLYGCFSALVAVFLASPSQALFFFLPGLETTILGSFWQSFMGAAIPEECAKLLMLWLLLRNNPYFDEHFDGIVYAVCVGMGFAGLENIMYVFQNMDDWMSVSVARAIFSVPGHFFFAVSMGYFYSCVHFHTASTPKEHRINQIGVLLVPIILHGFFDFFLFVTDLQITLLSSICFLLFLILCFYISKLGLRRIKHLIELDADPNADAEVTEFEEV